MTHHHPKLDLERYRPFLAPFVEWIEKEDLFAAQRWCARLDSKDPAQIEGAIAEAMAWDWLRCRVDRIELVRTERTKTPDFRCTKGGQTFFVEVTNISLECMTEACGLEHGEHWSGFRNLPIPSELFQREVRDKVQQAPTSPFPYLIMVVTLHDHGSLRMQDGVIVEWVLTSRTAIGSPVDFDVGESVGPLREVVDFRRSAFTKTLSVTPARRAISAAVFCPFGLVDARRFVMARNQRSRATAGPKFPSRSPVLGVLHPDALHPFAPDLLDDVAFCSFVVWPPKGDVKLKWVQGDQVLNEVPG